MSSHFLLSNTGRWLVTPWTSTKHLSLESVPRAGFGLEKNRVAKGQTTQMVDHQLVARFCQRYGKFYGFCISKTSHLKKSFQTHLGSCCSWCRHSEIPCLRTNRSTDPRSLWKPFFVSLITRWFVNLLGCDLQQGHKANSLWLVIWDDHHADTVFQCSKKILKVNLQEPTISFGKLQGTPCLVHEPVLEAAAAAAGYRLAVRNPEMPQLHSAELGPDSTQIISAKSSTSFGIFEPSKSKVVTS